MRIPEGAQFEGSYDGDTIFFKFSGDQTFFRIENGLDRWLYLNSSNSVGHLVELYKARPIALEDLMDSYIEEYGDGT